MVPIHRNTAPSVVTILLVGSPVVTWTGPSNFSVTIEIVDPGHQTRLIAILDQSRGIATIQAE